MARWISLDAVKKLVELLGTATDERRKLLKQINNGSVRHQEMSGEGGSNSWMAC